MELEQIFGTEKAKTCADVKAATYVYQREVVHRRVQNIHCFKLHGKICLLSSINDIKLPMMFSILLLQIYFSFTDSSFIHCEEIFITYLIF
ncbi:unnamed protein product [Brassica oleracea]